MKQKLAGVLRKIADRLAPLPEVPKATPTENGYEISFKGVKLARITAGSIAQ